MTLAADTTPSLNKILELAEVATVSKDGKTVTYKNGISKVEVTITADGHVDTVTVEQSGLLAFTMRPLLLARPILMAITMSSLQRHNEIIA